MKRIYILTLIALFVCAINSNAQFGGMMNNAKTKAKDAKNQAKPEPKTESKNPVAAKAKTSDDDSETRAENAKSLAKASGMPKPANSDAALNKLLFQAADDVRLIPRRVVVVDEDWLVTTGARNEKVRRIFAVIGRTLDDGSGKCGKQMVQFDQNWKEDKNAWGLIYVQNVGEITLIACSAIGK